MFKNRQDAGVQLTKRLEIYKGKNPLILGIPRGGIEVAYYVALHLKAELSVVISKKLPYPTHEEFAFGAVSEDDSMYIRQRDYLVTDEVIEKTMARCNQEVQRRINVYRNGDPLPDMRGRTVILVDDGIATGATLVPVIRLCRKRKAAKVIVAVPVAGRTFDKFLHEADEIIVLQQPESYQSVGQAYMSFDELNDQDVIHLLSKFPKMTMSANTH